MSDSATVGGVSSAVIGLSVTVAIVIVISAIMVIISLSVIIVLRQRQGMYGDSGHIPACTCVIREDIFFCIYFIAASYRVKAPSSKEGDYHLEDVKEVKLQSNPAYEAVNTT